MKKAIIVGGGRDARRQHACPRGTVGRHPGADPRRGTELIRLRRNDGADAAIPAELMRIWPISTRANKPDDDEPAMMGRSSWRPPPAGEDRRRAPPPAAQPPVKCRSAISASPPQPASRRTARCSTGQMNSTARIVYRRRSWRSPYCSRSCWRSSYRSPELPHLACPDGPRGDRWLCPFLCSRIREGKTTYLPREPSDQT